MNLLHPTSNEEVNTRLDELVLLAEILAQEEYKKYFVHSAQILKAIKSFEALCGEQNDRIELLVDTGRSTYQGEYLGLVGTTTLGTNDSISPEELLEIAAKFRSKLCNTKTQMDSTRKAVNAQLLLPMDLPEPILLSESGYQVMEEDRVLKMRLEDIFNHLENLYPDKYAEFFDVEMHSMYGTIELARNWIRYSKEASIRDNVFGELQVFLDLPKSRLDVIANMIAESQPELSI